MFYGEYNYKVDQKGRVAIPPEFRSEFKQGVVLAQGLEKCVTICPLPQWEKIAEKLVTLPPMRGKARRMNRLTFGTAFKLELDGQGRIMLPPPLRRYAEIEDTAVMVGVNNYLELWNEKNWEFEKAAMNEEAWQIFESMEKLG